jgi:hypothetical protein
VPGGLEETTRAIGTGVNMNKGPDRFLERDAVISDCGRYRYLLRRTWDARRPRVLFVMLNPSTADADNDDPTIRSCIRLSRALNYGSIEVVNLFSFRATKPDDLLEASDPIGPKNDGSIECAIVRCDLHICAWGAHPMAERRASCVRQLIRSHRPAVFASAKPRPVRRSIPSTSRLERRWRSLPDHDH